MCCFFSSNLFNLNNSNFNNGCRRTNPYRNSNCGYWQRGPQGPSGPQGPRGPQGPSGVSDAVYLNSGTQTVVAGAIIPLTLTTASPDSTLIVANNSVLIPTAGTYLVSYFVNGSVPQDTLSVSLYQNSVAIPNENITITIDNGNISSGSKTALITVTGPATISLYNTSATTATIDNASLLVMKIS